LERGSFRQVNKIKTREGKRGLHKTFLLTGFYATLFWELTNGLPGIFLGYYHTQN
jgi:hypothetical protein